MTPDEARYDRMRLLGDCTASIIRARDARNRITALERGLAADNERLAAIKLALAEAQDAIEIASPRSDAIEQPLAGLLAVLFAGLIGSVAVLAWGLWS